MVAANNKKKDDERDHDLLKSSQQEEYNIRFQSDPVGCIIRRLENDEAPLLNENTAIQAVTGGTKRV